MSQTEKNTGIYHRSINSTYKNWPEIVSTLVSRYKNWKKEFKNISAEYNVSIERLECKALDDRLIITRNNITILCIQEDGWNENVYQDGIVNYTGCKSTVFYPILNEDSGATEPPPFKFDYCNLPEEEHFQMSLMEKIADYKTCISVLDKFVEIEPHGMVFTFYPGFFDDFVLANLSNFLKGYDDE